MFRRHCHSFRWLAGRLDLARKAVAIGLMVAAAMFAQAAGAAPACDTLRLNGSFSWYPVVMREQDQVDADGIVPAVAAEIARRLNLTLVYAPIAPFKRQVLELENGTLDVILGAYWTRERADKFQYTSSVFDDEVAVFVRKGSEFAFNDWGDLKGRSGIRPYGGSYGEDFDRYAERNLMIRFVEAVPDTFSQNMLATLHHQREDFAVLGRFNGLQMIQQAGLAGKIVDLEKPITANAVHMLFSRTSPCAAVVDRFEATLRELKAEGWVDELLTRYERPG